MAHGPTLVVVLADGLPTDRDAYVLAARRMVEELDPGVLLHVGVSAGTPLLAAHGLGGRVHELPTDDAEALAEAAVRILREAIAAA